LGINPVIALIMNDDGAESAQLPAYKPYLELGTFEIFVHESTDVKGKQNRCFEATFPSLEILTRSSQRSN
jgi:hypothetical protein